MLTPNELEAVPEQLTKIYRGLQFDILNDIIARVAVNGEISRAADWEITRLYEMGVAKEVIKREIKRALSLTESEIDRIYSEVLAEDYARYEPIYRRLGRSFIPYRENKQLQQLVGGVKAQTFGEFKNITQSLGFAVKNADGTRTFQPIAKVYQRTLDNAAFSMLSGVYDYNTILKKAVKELTGSGLRTVDYETGWSNRVEVAARRALMTGFHQVTGKITEDNAEKLGADHFEVTWHRGARPTHQPWQGKVYTKEQLVTVCGYGAVDGLKGANCRHDFHPFFPGISKRLYTDEQLDEMNARENTPREYNGRQYTVYEATQRQRQLETKLRRKREEIALLEKGGANEDDILAAKAKYHTLSNEYAQFSKAMDLPQQRERVRIDGRKGVNVGFGTQAAENKPKQTVTSTLKPKPEISTPKEENIPINGADVKAEYDKNATPGKGQITFDKRFDDEKYVKDHQNEIEFAKWLHGNYGGDIHLLGESTDQRVKTPDYLWNNKYWDLKSISTEKAANSAVRKGVKQIVKNPGGIMLDCGEVDFSMDLLKQVISKRMEWYEGYQVDIMIIGKMQVLKVLRYKK